MFGDAGGCVGFILAHAEPETLKQLSRFIEDTHPMGRLFDIDVLRQDRRKISRRDTGEANRPCLICGGDAFVCGRSRAHSVGELQNAAVSSMRRFRREKLGEMVAQAALRALVGEAAVTPKPGLVDRTNNGAHRDMDFFTFIDSTAVIIPYFRNCACAGFDAADEAPAELFRRLRPGGKIAELEMHRATGGPNTHKGLIFSMGLASAAFGALYRRREKIDAAAVLEFIAAMTCHITDDFEKECGSHGEIIHRRYGIGGVREEARRGFPSVRDWALPALRRSLTAGYSLNDAGIAVFLHLLGRVTDTNIIHRSGPEALAEIQKDAAAFLATNPGSKEINEYAAKLDREFIEKNISPGGCADLLALRLFLYRLCGE
jgi:holo-ACP synthase/triphosphoribosyl-dephospho-CoA synthase